MAQNCMIRLILLDLIANNLYYLLLHVLLPTERKCFCHTDVDNLVLEMLVLTRLEYLDFHLNILVSRLQGENALPCSWEYSIPYNGYVFHFKLEFWFDTSVYPGERAKSTCV